jgi:hypothetical protein
VKIDRENMIAKVREAARCGLDDGKLVFGRDGSGGAYYTQNARIPGEVYIVHLRDITGPPYDRPAEAVDRVLSTY